MTGAGNVPADFACSVDAHLFASVALARSNEETRYYLHGVGVEPCADGGVLMVATNGHVLLAARDPKGWCRGAAIVRPDAALLRAASAKGKDKSLPGRALVASANRAAVCSVKSEHEASDGDLVWLSEPGPTVLALQWRDVCIDGAFPDWRRVLPVDAKPALQAAIAMQPGYLRVLGQAMGKVLSFSIRDHNSAILVSGGPSNIFGLLMPCRVDDTPSVPAWTRKCAAQAAKAKSKVKAKAKAKKRKTS